MKARNEPLESNRYIDLQDQFIIVGGWFQSARLGFDLVKSLADGGIINLASLGEFGAPGIPAEKLDAEALFQGFYLVAYGGAGYAQFTGREPETAEPGSGFKSGQSAQWGQVTSGQITSPMECLRGT
jgi:hypothetical protein